MIRELIEPYYKKVLNKIEDSRFNKLDSVMDFSNIINGDIKDIKSITFVIPGMRKYSGGHTSILRLGTCLSDLGYDVRYVTYTNQKKNDMEKQARMNLVKYQGVFYENDVLYSIDSDIVIATFWESVFFVKKMIGYKMYFVQDFEPYFYEYGEKHLIAKKTYELGLHIISLGKWNCNMIEQQCSIKGKIDYIDFPYEESEYKYVKRDFYGYKEKKTLKIAVYLKFNAKRAPYLIQNFIQNLKKEFLKDEIVLDVYYYGDDKKIKLKGGTNLGKLSKDELSLLYENSDFGLVASLTNISLVPYEMISKNLPVIEFEEGTFKYFFDDSSAIITSFDYNDAYNQILKCIKDPNELVKITNNARTNSKGLSWNNSTKKFIEIIESVRNY